MKNLLAMVTCVLFLMSCSKTDQKDVDTSDENTMVLKENDKVASDTKKKTDWEEVDVTSPVVDYEEVTSDGIEVRAGENYSVYSVDEKILFDFDKATIREGGEQKLAEVVKSVKKRHPEASIAVKGHTDAVGSKEYNKDLSEDRAQAVADYIRENSDLSKDDVTILAMGEQDPASTNETAEGRQDNRRVEIMVRNDQ